MSDTPITDACPLKELRSLARQMEHDLSRLRGVIDVLQSRLDYNVGLVSAVRNVLDTYAGRGAVASTSRYCNECGATIGLEPHAGHCRWARGG